MSKKFTDQECIDAIRLVETALAKGGVPPGSRTPGRSVFEMAADLREDLGYNSLPKGHASIRRRIDEARERGLGSVDWSLHRPAQYQKQPSPDRSPVVHTSSPALKPAGDIVRVCVIPDIHIAPDIRHDRMLWIGRWCADMKPDHIVQLGDWLTLDSLSTHAQPGTIQQIVLPAFKDDIIALKESVALFDKGFEESKSIGPRPQRVVTLGNHEDRAARFENRTPEMEGMVLDSILSGLNEGGWRTIPYGQFHFIEGVGFIHHVNNALGRPYGGKTAANRIATDSNFSTVSGHTHQRQSASVPKIGPNFGVRAISAGCALEHNHVEQYAKHSTTGWEYGCLLLGILDGVILDEQWFSMITLESRYRD